MQTDPLNIPPVSIDTLKQVLLAQFKQPELRQRATMIWGTRGIGKSSVVRQIADECHVPLIDLRLTTIEPVDLRGALFADDQTQRTVWFPPEFLPESDAPTGILFLDEITAADQRLQTSAYSLILDRAVGNYRLPDGWQIIAAGNAAFHGAVSHDMGTALADRLFHFHVQASLPAFVDYALAHALAPEVLAYLQVRPDKLDNTHHQLAQDHLVGTSPRGWEDVATVLAAPIDEASKQRLIEGRIGAANAAEFFAVLKDIQAGTDVTALLDAAPGAATKALLPKTLDGLYGVIYGLASLCRTETLLQRAMTIVEQFNDLPGTLPTREAQTLAMELLLQRALTDGLDNAVINSPAYQRYSERREVSGLG